MIADEISKGDSVELPDGPEAEVTEVRRTGDAVEIETSESAALRMEGGRLDVIQPPRCHTYTTTDGEEINEVLRT